MKRRPTTQRGSVVLVALCLTTVLAIAVTGYVAVCARTMELSNRSFCYTSSVQLAETGLEEALWALDQALNTSGYAWSGWTLTTDGSGVKWASKQLTGFTVNKGVPGVVNIQIQYYDHYRAPAVYGTQPPTIISDGVVQMSDGITIDKQLKVTVKPAALFSNAAGSTGSASSGYYVYFEDWSGALVNSYDSTQNGGTYTPSPSQVNRSDKAIISGPYVYVYNATILGYAASANQTASAPWVSSGGSVTSIDPSTGLNSSTRIDSSRECNSGNQYAFDLVTPSGAGSVLPTSGSIGPGFYYYTAGVYTQPYYSTLTITGPATIYTSSDLTVNGSFIVSSASTGPVQIFARGTLTVAGNGITNQTRLPTNLALFCTSTTGYVWLNTDTDFYGAVYAPNVPVYVYQSVVLYGALAGQSVIFDNGTPRLHYDLALRKTSFSLVNTPYVISQWLVN